MCRVLVDSGIGYLGNIPSEWNIFRIKNAFKCGKNIVNDNWSNTQLLSLTTSGVKEKDIDNPKGKLPDSFDGYQYVEKNNIIMCLFDLDCSAVFSGISKYNGMVSPAYKVLECKEMMNPDYAGYYFNYISFDRKYMHYSKNIRYTLNYDEFSSLPMLIPPLEEQRKIAEYLDKQCAKIDEIISDNNREIELLEEYKKTLITEVITSGLNKNSTFKESQIPWMGKIPSHYEVVTLKRLGTARNGLSYSPGEVADNGILVLRSSNIQNNKLSLNDNVYVKKEINEDLLLKENDLLICSRNGSKNLIGKNILINKDMKGQTFGAFMCVYRSKYNKYIRYVLNSHIFDYYLANFLTSTINQLTTSNLYSIKIPFTYNIEEQEKIIKYLDKQCSKLDSVIEYRKQIIEKLEEYKKSLIYEYVTGKREV
mgnify:CR=1 FL=1|jgi:putative type I restriction-modification system specificity determinant for hsdM and hsdR (hsdS)